MEEAPPRDMPPNSADGRQYVHQESLDETRFRLMLLHGGALETPLRCDFEVHSMQSKGQTPSYVALSYVWGMPPADQEVLCNGRKLLIRENLAQALVMFRPTNPNDKLYMWADQLCINQEDVTERSAQVNLMKHIFSDAANVWVWLGPTENEETIHLMRLHAMAEQSGWFESTSRTFPSDEVLTDAKLPVRDSPEWRALDRMTSNPYWTRIWVIQEAVLAKSIRAFWGTGEISWYDLMTLVMWASTSIGFMDSPYKFLSSMVVPSLSMASSVDRSLGKLVLGTLSYESWDPRDKIFALLGIAKTLKADMAPMKADYSLPLDEVNKRFTRYAIEDDETLQILSYVQNRDAQSLQRSCTWAGIRSELYPKPFDMLASFDACRGCGPELRQASENTLPLKGIRLGRVRTCVGEINQASPRIHQAILNAWRISCGTDETVEQYSKLRDFVWTLTAGQAAKGTWGLGSPAGEDILLFFSAFLQSSILRDWVAGDDSVIQTCPRASLELAKVAVNCYKNGKEQESVLKPYTAESLQWFEDHIALLHPREVMISVSDIASLFYHIKTDDQLAYVEFRDIMLQTTTSRTFFTTKDGDMGLGPLSVEENDVICVLLGGDTPYVLRPTELPGEWLFVGECYIKKWMDGLAIDLMRDGELESEWFTLC